jgi:hypothetical protein
MKLLAVLALVVLASAMSLGQVTGSNRDSKTSAIADELKQLREAIDQQQKQMAEQQKQIADQQRRASENQKQITEQQIEIERLKQQLTAQPQAASANGAAPAGHVVNASLAAPSASSAANSVSDMAAQEHPKESPLSFRIGGTDFTPGGFVEFENVFRSTNSGSVMTTNFGNIPFSNTPQGHLTEDRVTGQFSRLNLKVTGKYGDSDITGYVEVDSNGNDAGNAFVTGNSHTLRDRLFWVDLKRHNWEILGGQSWSFLTPNRRGVSPMPSDLAITYDEDGNVQVGIPYTQAAELRLIYYPNEHFAAGVAIENAEQMTGGTAQEIIFPAAFAGQLTTQFNPGNGNNTTPNVAPDFIPKIAYDRDFGNRHFHFEASGLLTTVKASTQQVAGGPFQSSAKTGASGGAAMNFELVHNFRVLANAFYGEGGGHYMIGLGPSAVVRPDGTVSLVHSGMGLAGFEYHPTAKTLFGLYYGATYFQRNTFLIRAPVPSPTRSSDSAGLLLSLWRAPTTGPFNNLLWIGPKPSGATRSMVRSS